MGLVRANYRRRRHILYDVGRREALPLALALAIDRSGRVEPFEPPPAAALPPTRWWRVARGRGPMRPPVIVAETLEDAPFYARSVRRPTSRDEPVTAMHESLSLDRFRTGWVQALLPFRMPRGPGEPPVRARRFSGRHADAGARAGFPKRRCLRLVRTYLSQ